MLNSEKMNLPLRMAVCATLAIGFAAAPARADVYCPNAAVQGGYTNTFTSFAGSLDGTCGANSGVQVSIATNIDYGKLTWTPYATSGASLGDLIDVSASVEFTSAQPSDGPYFELAFVDPGCDLGQCTGGGAATDQILLIGFGDTSLTQATPGQTTTLDPATTILHLYDNTTDTDLQGGIAGAQTLAAWLSGALAPDASQPITDFRIAIGLAAGSCSNCSETLAVDSMTLVNTPEPGTFVLVGIPVVLLARMRRRNTVRRQ